jgi:hypothetical protein
MGSGRISIAASELEDSAKTPPSYDIGGLQCLRENRDAVEELGRNRIAGVMAKSGRGFLAASSVSPKTR